MMQTKLKHKIRSYSRLYKAYNNTPYYKNYFTGYFYSKVLPKIYLWRHIKNQIVLPYLDYSNLKTNYKC